MPDPIDAASPLSLREPRSGRPLRILITRPDEQAEETAALVRAAGGLPLVYPCLRRAPPSDLQAFRASLLHPDGYDLVAITSANAAHALSEQLEHLPLDAATRLRQALFAAVGPRTAAALATHGLSARIVAEETNTGEGLAAAVVKALQARGPFSNPPRVLFPRAAVANSVLVVALRGAGVEVIETVAYEMLPAPAEALAPMASLLRAGEVDLLPFGSPRTAAVALAAIDLEPSSEALRRVVIGAIGPSTEAALVSAGLRVDVVAQPATFEALLHDMSIFFSPLHAPII